MDSSRPYHWSQPVASQDWRNPPQLCRHRHDIRKKNLSISTVSKAVAEKLSYCLINIIQDYQPPLQTINLPLMNHQFLIIEHELVQRSKRKIKQTLNWGIAPLARLGTPMSPQPLAPDEPHTHCVWSPLFLAESTRYQPTSVCFANAHN